MSFFFTLTCLLEHARFSGFVLSGASLRIHVVEASSRSPLLSGQTRCRGSCGPAGSLRWTPHGLRCFCSRVLVKEALAMKSPANAPPVVVLEGMSALAALSLLGFDRCSPSGHLLEAAKLFNIEKSTILVPRTICNS